MRAHGPRTATPARLSLRREFSGDGEDLVGRHEAALEPLARDAQVDPPHPHALVAGELACAIDVGLEAALPLEQRARVVLGEVLDCDRVQPGALDRGLDPRQVQRRRVREHVALRERAGLGVADPQPGDPVVEDPPARPHQPRELREVRVDVDAADVLDHADRGDRVERLARQLAIVHHAEVDAVFQPGLARPLARELRLRLGERDPGDVDAVLARGVERERAPAAADVEHALARLQRQLRADQLQLRLAAPPRASSRRATRSRTSTSSTRPGTARSTRWRGCSGG